MDPKIPAEIKEAQVISKKSVPDGKMIVWAKPQYHPELKAWLATQFGEQKHNPQDLELELREIRQTSLAREVSKKRKQLNLSQTKLSKLAGISRNSLVRIETGYKCYFHTAILLATILDIDLNTLKPPISLESEIAKLES